MIFAPFAYRKIESTAGGYDAAVTAWSNSTGITNGSVLTAVNTFVTSLKTDSIWNKMVCLYPLIADTDTSSTAKDQFKYNLKDVTTYTATYLNNNGTGNKGGWSPAGSDTFVPGINAGDMPTNYMIGVYTTSSAALPDEIDAGCLNSGADTYIYLVGGRDQTRCGGGYFEQLMRPSKNSAAYVNSCGVTGSFYAKGLISMGGNGTTGYGYREGDVQTGTAGSYSATERGGAYKVGFGSFLLDTFTALSPTRKVYQLFYISEYLSQTDMTNLESAVNTLQSSIDSIYSTNRNNRS